MPGFSSTTELVVQGTFDDVSQVAQLSPGTTCSELTVRRLKITAVGLALLAMVLLIALVVTSAQRCSHKAGVVTPDYYFPDGALNVTRAQPRGGCCFLTGNWTNHHGSIMVVYHFDDGRLEGTYRTAVSSTAGASSGTRALHGRAGHSKVGGVTFAFTVTYGDGSSSAAWSGMYENCSGSELLRTTWTLTSMAGCDSVWSNTRVGQDLFTRGSS